MRRIARSSANLSAASLTAASAGSFSPRMLAMVFKLLKTAEQKWRTLKGYKLLARVVQGMKFKDGLWCDYQMDRNYRSEPIAAEPEVSSNADSNTT